jgi:hypothetical protein
MIDFLIKSSVSLNESVLAEYKQQLNEHARLREHILPFAAKIKFVDADSIKIQASALAQSTAITSELTREISVSSRFSFFVSFT